MLPFVFKIVNRSVESASRITKLLLTDLAAIPHCETFPSNNKILDSAAVVCLSMVSDALPRLDASILKSTADALVINPFPTTCN